MDSKVQTRVAESRRTKYIIVGLLACICVLSYMLYKENTVKKELIRRKTFYLGKIYDCRTASEKTNTKYKSKKAENDKLMSALTEKQNAHEETIKQFNDLQSSYESKKAELQVLQTSASENKKSLSELQQSYDNAMESVKHIQGQLDATMTVCNKHKGNSQSLNRTIAEKMKELETCAQEKSALEQENRSFKSKVEAIKNSMNVASNMESNPAASSAVQTQSNLVRSSRNAAKQASPTQQSTDLKQTVVKSTGPTAVLSENTDESNGSNVNEAQPGSKKSPTSTTRQSSITEKIQPSLKQSTTEQTMDSTQPASPTSIHWPDN